MGTNYYARTNICPHCGHYDERHIGKSSAGWTFSFHGYRPSVLDEQEPLLDSWNAWKDYLQQPGVKIFDECGDEVSCDAFVKMVEAKKSEAFNHTTYCRQNYAHSHNDELDDEGNSISYCDFS